LGIGKEKNEIKVSVPPKQPPEPFTLKEIQAIIEKFGSDPELQHFLDYLKVKFCTGLRTGEVAALRRRHCSSECDRIWIGETLTGSGENRKPKAAKRNKNRTVPLTLHYKNYCSTADLKLGKPSRKMIRFFLVLRDVRSTAKISAIVTGNLHSLIWELIIENPISPNTLSFSML
jgi:integrase